MNPGKYFAVTCRFEPILNLVSRFAIEQAVASLL